MLVNIYNTNNEPDQLKPLTGFGKILDYVGDIQNTNIIFGNDFHVICDYFLKVPGEKPSLKKQTLAKVIQIKKKFNIADT